jgi:uncharacterized protein YdaU (DUF1376 family)
VSRLPFLPLAVESWVTDTVHLTRAERGMYLDLLCLMWTTPGCRVPNDLAWIVRKLRCQNTEIETLKSIIAEFCTTTGNWLMQKRLTREYERASRTSKIRSDSAKARWEKEKAPCKSNAPTPTPTPTPIIGEPNGSLPPISPQKKPPGFELPEWVPEAEWAGFLEMRRSIRAPLTDRAKAGIVRQLERLRELGHPPGPVLDQSTRNAWRGVFPLKEIDIEQRGLPANRQYRRDPAWERFCQLAEEYAADPDGFGREADEGDEGD